MSIIEQKLNSFEEDVFNRKIIAENLTKIIESQDKSIVISLDSEWGTGKTTFVKMWQNMLDTDEYNDRFKAIYFNAWENDYIKEPLIALFSELEEQINQENSELKQTFEKVKKAITPLLKSAAIMGIKLSTSGLLDFEKTNLGDNTEKTLMNSADKLGEFAINRIKDSKNERIKFKQAMDEFQKKSKKKIIFFIDELDRCRPTFSIELLEVIKHLFNVGNCAFVISIDKEQLSHSVATIYGRDMDTIGYLRRFFDFDYKLPKIDLRKYVEIKNSVFENKYNVELFKMLIKEKFVQERFSLRDIDKTYYYIDLLMPLVKEFNSNEEYGKIHIVTISYLYATLIAVKIKKPTLYKQVIDREYVVNDILSKFRVPNLDHYNEQIIGEWHHEPLQKVINNIIKPFLTLNLIYNKNNTIYDENEFIISRDGNSDPWDDKFNLVKVFNYEGMNIINKLEFIENFELN